MKKRYAALHLYCKSEEEREAVKKALLLLRLETNAKTNSEAIIKASEKN
jgi:hypothetical protein